MTRERRLAVQMWREISENIRNNFFKKGSDIIGYKIDFCQKYGLEWLNNCYFCQYASEFSYNRKGRIILNCNRCPLKSCERGSPYYGIITLKLETSYKMAVKIADILEGVNNEV